MKIRQTDHLVDNAEGRCHGYPYSTELAGPGGVSIHFWVGAEPVDHEKLQVALDKARGARDVLYASWSYGEPTKFWANSDIV
jgi:hypothetical protein